MAPRTEVVAEGNFLIPNGTFFVELLIFLIVLGVIWMFVVPPIRAVLTERDARVAKTAADDKEAKDLFVGAEARYKAAIAEARSEVVEIRNRARAEGRAILEQLRGEAQEEADRIVAESATELRARADQVAAELRETVEPLARTLADRVLGVDDRTSAGNQAGRA
ncbi:F0F1 ATP synthase subunit B [Nocardia sp. KC 131]|uniref:F0F1 ATP synthase subunit B n=1 Tax=Nocardia arseniciresistens TaxID=3392119 RepID=UPI00398ED872